MITLLRRKAAAPPDKIATRRVVVALIHPTNYDHNHEGIGSFASTYTLGVIPSNTLRLLDSLSREALAAAPFDILATEVHSFEDSIRSRQRAFRHLLARFPDPGTLLVVGFVGVQSNQFPRMLDLLAATRARTDRPEPSDPSLNR